MLLRAVGSCWAKFETVKCLSQQLPTFCSEAQCNNVGSVFTALQTFLGPLTCITHGLQSLMVCIISTMHCRSQYCLPTHNVRVCWILLHVALGSYQSWASTFVSDQNCIDDDFPQSNLVKTKMNILSATVFVKSLLLFLIGTYLFFNSQEALFQKNGFQKQKLNTHLNITALFCL